MKTVWIIGASAGIGKSLAIELDRKGYSVALSARNEKKLEALSKKLKNKSIIAPCDVTKKAHIENALKDVQKAFEKIDNVIFMAGIYTPMSLEKLDLKKTKQIIDVNLMGAFNLIEVVLPALNSQKSSQLVLCASVAGYRGLPGSQPYGSTKAALINLAESLRCEVGKKIDIKVINPGFVKTRLTDKNDFDMPMRITPEKAAEAIIKGLESKRFEIHFPKAFTLSMKLLSCLPEKLYTYLVTSKKG